MINYSHLKNISWKQIRYVSQNFYFREIVWFSNKLLTKHYRWFHVKFEWSINSKEKMFTTFYIFSFNHIFRQIVLQQNLRDIYNFFQHQLQNRILWFDGKINGTVFKNVRAVHTVWKLRKFTLTHFWQTFHEFNVFLKKSWFDEKNSVRENFAFFHSALWAHNVEITEIHFHAILAKISWK